MSRVKHKTTTPICVICYCSFNNGPVPLQGIGSKDDNRQVFTFLFQVLNAQLDWDFDKELIPLCLRCSCIVHDIFQLQKKVLAIQGEIKGKVQKIRSTVLVSEGSKKNGSNGKRTRSSFLDDTNEVEIIDDKFENFRKQILTSCDLDDGNNYYDAPATDNDRQYENMEVVQLKSPVVNKVVESSPKCYTVTDDTDFNPNYVYINLESNSNELEHEAEDVDPLSHFVDEGLNNIKTNSNTHYGVNTSAAKRQNHKPENPTHNNYNSVASTRQQYDSNPVLRQYLNGTASTSVRYDEPVDNLDHYSNLVVAAAPSDHNNFAVATAAANHIKQAKSVSYPSMDKPQNWTVAGKSNSRMPGENSHIKNQCSPSIDAGTNYCGPNQNPILINTVSSLSGISCPSGVNSNTILCHQTSDDQMSNTAYSVHEQMKTEQDNYFDITAEEEFEDERGDEENFYSMDYSPDMCSVQGILNQHSGLQCQDQSYTESEEIQERQNTSGIDEPPELDFKEIDRAMFKIVEGRPDLRKCTLCNKIFLKANGRKHRFVHLPGSYVCPWSSCKSVYTRKDNLNSHMKLKHAGRTPG